MIQVRDNKIILRIGNYEESIHMDEVEILDDVPKDYPEFDEDEYYPIKYYDLQLSITATAWGTCCDNGEDYIDMRSVEIKDGSIDMEDIVHVEGKYLREIEYVNVYDDSERYTEDEYVRLKDNFVKIRAIKTGDWDMLKLKSYQKAIINEYQRTLTEMIEWKKM